ncbi:MAG: ribonuclease R [Methylophilaceae bacterium]|nr:ribonuclease R [Methylophilaceae bacterium]
MKNNNKNIRDNDPQKEREDTLYENPIPSRELILEVMTNHGVPIKKDDLINLLDIKKNEIIFFEKRLRAMARQGQILINRKDILCVSEKLNLISGRVMGHPDGFGFLIPDDKTVKDIFLSPRELSQVLNNDRVMVQVTGQDRKGRLEGTIVEILERVNKIIVGRVVQGEGVTIVAAEDKRINQDFLISHNDDMNAKTGQVVEIEVTTQPARRVKPMGKIIKILGNYNDSGIEIEIALRKHHLPYEFSSEALHQAETYSKSVPASAHKGRKDLRNLPLVTIDGETARDFDDAVYAVSEKDGWRLIVAIADVSSYVSPKTPLDEEALERGNSVYFPRRVIPMLPEALSNGLCSLNPNVDRLCMVCDMLINDKGKVTSYEFYPSVMNSRARLTYTIVDQILNQNNRELQSEYENIVPHLINLQKVFDVLFEQRQLRSAIEFDSTETTIIFNDQGKIDFIKPVYRNQAHRIIEECMLSANVCAADFLLDNNSNGLFRNHETPTPEKLENLRGFLLEFGLSLSGGDKPTSKNYGELIKKVTGRPDEHLLQTVLLRSMQQAVYSKENKGHFGLAYEAYTHFTSPIRRYPDLIVHRAIKEKLAGKKSSIKNISQIAMHCSGTERKADDATRDVESWLKCYFMQDKVGKIFEGTVAGVTGFGLFVELDDIYIEGLLHVTELGSDYFAYDKQKHAMVGERTSAQYRLGDRLKVKVVRVDLETSKIDFSLVGGEKRKKNKIEKKRIKKRR